MINYSLLMIGLLYIVLIFFVCFTVVHFVKLAIVGFQSFRKKPPAPKSPEKKVEKKVEPVYYIVEKKRAKRTSYSAPKEITFKETER